MPTKVCITCRERLDVSEFHKDKGRAFGVTNVCKCCKAERHAKKMDRLRSGRSKEDHTVSEIAKLAMSAPWVRRV